MRCIPSVLVALGLSVLAAAANADVSPFQTPSGNIQCTIGIGEASADLSCTILEREGAPAAPALAACGPNEDHDFLLFETGPVTVSCVPASGGNPYAEVAAYGVGAQWGRLSCTSSQQGLECRNGDGHGFFLSRRVQRIW